MEIRQNAWHYRFMKMTDSINWFNHPKDLCSYIRRFIWSCFKVTFVSIAVFLVAMMTTILPLMHSYMTLGAGWGNPIVAQTMGLIIWSIVFIAYSFYLITSEIAQYRYRKEKAHEEWVNSLTLEEYEAWKMEQHAKIRANLIDKKPNLFVQWVRDRHDKICTTINYEGRNHSND